MAGRKKPSVYTRALEQVQQARREEQDQPAVQASEHSASQPSSHLATQPAKQRRIKATFYLRPDDIIAIDEMQTKRFRAQGKKPEKSELVSEAIQLLAQQSTEEG